MGCIAEFREFTNPVFVGSIILVFVAVVRACFSRQGDRKAIDDFSSLSVIVLVGFATAFLSYGKITCPTVCDFPCSVLRIFNGPIGVPIYAAFAYLVYRFIVYRSICKG
jgi:hypothetical protein